MIPIHNVYYMLAYAFQVLNEQGYRDMATESFDNVAELCAAILAKGTSIQLKRGLNREYIEQSERLSAPKGKLEIAESLKTRSLLQKQLVCTHDDFSPNAYMNQIIKTTMLLLLRSDISNRRKKELRKILVFFSDIDTLNIHLINWNIQYNQNNQTYQMLISICYLVIKGLLQTQTDGSTRLMDFLDEQRMHRLYEKFILEYYRKEHPELTANASRIPWQLDDEVNEMLPVMQTDIMLTKGNSTLIIDAKYYAHSTQVQYDRHTLHSGNMYQIFTYVKNKEAALAGLPHQVSGLLLYAKTDEEISPNHEYRMSGNRIGVQSLDLSGNFDSIRCQLDTIVSRFFDEAV